jgi:hypothetical protein
MNDYATSSEAEKLLRRTNQFIASSLAARRRTKPQVKISKKSAITWDCASIPPKEEGGGWRRQHANAYKISV